VSYSDFHSFDTSWTDPAVDDAMLKYARVTSLPQPRAKERSLLHEWIQSPALGGGCGFLGPDLGGFDQPAIYEEKYQKDLVILTDNHGEDDVFTQFVTGPFLRWCNQILKFAKVCEAPFR
jgi:hypothetical protein